MSLVDRAPLIGRASELAQLVAVLHDGRPGVVLIGHGGVGKTRLARAAVAVEAARGVEVAATVATRSTASVPLGALAGLVDDPDVRPERLIAHARQAIRARAGDGRLVILVDDAHLVDDVSAGVLLALADVDEVSTLLTVRLGEPVPDAITALWKDAGLDRVDLDPLPDDETDQLAELLAGGPLDAPSRAGIRRAAQGNPLAVIELVREASRQGLISDEAGVLRLDGRVPVSARLNDLIADRLRGLTDHHLRALALVALAEPTDLRQLYRVGVDRTTLVELEQRQQITIADDGRSSLVGLSHPLIGDVALERLGDLVRRELLSSLVDDLTDSTTAAGGPMPDDAVRLAVWSLDAGLDPEPDLLVAAARRTWERTDHRRTAELAREAWRRRRDAPTGHLLGYALGRTGQPAEADAVLADAWALASDDRERLLIGLARVDVLFRGLGDAEAARRWSHTVEDSLTDTDMRLEVAAGRATLEVQAGHIRSALSMARPMLAAGTPPRAFVTASYASGLAMALGGSTGEAMQVAGAALPVHEQVWRDDLFATEPGIHHVVTAIALAEAGRLDDAEQLTELGVQVAGAAGRGYGFGFFAMLHGMVLVRRGRTRTGSRWCREAAAALRWAGYPGTGRWALAALAHASVCNGELDQARRALAEADALKSGTPIRMNEAFVDDARGWLHLSEGDPDAARNLFGDAAETHATDGAVAGAALLAHSLARVGAAEAALEILEPLADQADGRLVELRRDHARALAARDPADLEVVGERWNRLGLPLEAAESHAAASRLHHRRGETRTAAACRRRATELLDTCEGAALPTLRDLGVDAVEPLSEREREIAVLVADGLTSRAVSERLVVSRRTVDNHLQRIYRKLGITRRDDLRSALASPGERPDASDSPSGPDSPDTPTT